MIQIWTPRYRDNTVLIATYKVMAGANEIEFTKAKHLKGMVFVALGSDIVKCKTQKNGRIDVYVVPMALLRRVK